MANHASALKRARRNAKQAQVNGVRKNRVRTYIKKVEMAIEAGNSKDAQDAYKAMRPELARAVAKGIFHKNTAARKMSRLSARIKGIK